MMIAIAAQAAIYPAHPSIPKILMQTKNYPCEGRAVRLFNLWPLAKQVYRKPLVVIGRWTLNPDNFLSGYS